MSRSTLAGIVDEALMDEYKARNSYQKIIETFGPVRPFINIVEAPTNTMVEWVSSIKNA